MIIIDNAGYKFIDAANESELFKDNNLHLKFFEFDSNKEGNEYAFEIKKVRRAYDQGTDIKVFKQNFTSEYIRKANVLLQGNIDHKRIWFASKAVANNKAFDRYSACNIKLDYAGAESILDLIELQDSLIYHCSRTYMDSTVNVDMVYRKSSFQKIIDMPSQFGTNEFNINQDYFTGSPFAHCYNYHNYIDMLLYKLHMLDNLNTKNKFLLNN